MDAVDEYESSLADLKANSKPLINALTILAEENTSKAPHIVKLIENRIKKAKPEEKLPIIYLLDSIIKNVREPFLDLFAHNIVTTFCNTFERVDGKTRNSLFKLRSTWDDYFPGTKLFEVDTKVKAMDPCWPIANSYAQTRMTQNYKHPTNRSGGSTFKESTSRDKSKAHISSRSTEEIQKLSSKDPTAVLSELREKGVDVDKLASLIQQKQKNDEALKKQVSSRDPRLNKQTPVGVSSPKSNEDHIIFQEIENLKQKTLQRRADNARKRSEVEASIENVDNRTKFSSEPEEEPVVTEIEIKNFQDDTPAKKPRYSYDTKTNSIPASEFSAEEKGNTDKACHNRKSEEEFISLGAANGSKSHKDVDYRGIRSKIKEGTLPPMSVNESVMNQAVQLLETDQLSEKQRVDLKRNLERLNQLPPHVPKGDIDLRNQPLLENKDPAFLPQSSPQFQSHPPPPPTAEYEHFESSAPIPFNDGPPPQFRMGQSRFHRGMKPRIRRGRGRLDYDPNLRPRLSDGPRMRSDSYRPMARPNNFMPRERQPFTDEFYHRPPRNLRPPFAPRGDMFHQEMPHPSSFNDQPRSTPLLPIPNNQAPFPPQNRFPPVEQGSHFPPYPPTSGVPPRSNFNMQYMPPPAPALIVPAVASHSESANIPPPFMSAQQTSLCYTDSGFPVQPSTSVAASSENLKAEESVDISSLLTKLKEYGLLTSNESSGNGGDSTPTRDDSVDVDTAGTSDAPSQSQEEPFTTSDFDPIATVHPISFETYSLKLFQQGVIQRMYQGMQCGTCGLRYPIQKSKMYAVHLDWHFRQKKRAKDGYTSSSREWYHVIDDWLQLSNIADKNCVGFGQVKVEEVSDENDNDEKLIKVDDESISLAIEHANDADEKCKICREKFEQFWHEQDDNWHLKNAIRVEGKTVHFHCYKDFKGTSVPTLNTPNVKRDVMPFSFDRSAASLYVKSESSLTLSIENLLHTSSNHTNPELRTPVVSVPIAIPSVSTIQETPIRSAMPSAVNSLFHQFGTNMKFPSKNIENNRISGVDSPEKPAELSDGDDASNRITTTQSDPTAEEVLDYDEAISSDEQQFKSSPPEPEKVVSDVVVEDPAVNSEDVKPQISDENHDTKLSSNREKACKTFAGRKGSLLHRTGENFVLGKM